MKHGLERLIHLVRYDLGGAVSRPSALVQRSIEQIGHLEDVGPASKVRVVGVDVQRLHVTQAMFVNRALGLDIEFRRA